MSGFIPPNLTPGERNSVQAEPGTIVSSEETSESSILAVERGRFLADGKEGASPL